MRIIHTSDWHIGRRFERESLEDDQRSFLTWLAGQVSEHGVDLVLVAGDIYDRSQPAEDAVALLDQGLDGLRAAGAEILLVPGNHDSARRLGFGAARQALGGVHVFADDQHPPVPWVFGAGDDRVAVVAVPFLDPYAVPAPHPAADGSPRARTHEHVLADALESAWALLSPADQLPTICVAHAYVSGAVESDSERVLSIGGTDRVDASVFAGFDYVALGHLHRPQRIDGNDTVAYSGSPLPYSFSEDHAKSVRLLEVDATGFTDIRTIPVPVGRPVVTLTGTLDELLSHTAHDRYLEHWVAARLTDETVRTQPMERLRARFPYAVHMRYVPRADGTTGSVGNGPAGIRFEEQPKEDVIVEFLTELRGREPAASERELVSAALTIALGSEES
jgi:DNA repair protein SbcD/Mre11